MGAYLLILVAYRQAPAGYVVAVRESSIVLAAALGVLVLKEPMSRIKGFSVAAIVTGIVLIKLA